MKQIMVTIQGRQFCPNISVIEDEGRIISLQNGLAPLIIFTSNSEKHLPDAFLRRCIYHHLRFPDINSQDEKVRKREWNKLERIVSSRLANYPTSCTLLTEAKELMRELRADTLGLTKPPATAELLDWLNVLREMGFEPNDNLKGRPALRDTLGTLVKSREDIRAAEGRVFSEWFPSNSG